jgi:hypothetical protein
MKYFKDLKIGVEFVYNGICYYKKSSRTAVMIHNKRVFYFGMLDNCYDI